MSSASCFSDLLNQFVSQSGRVWMGVVGEQPHEQPGGEPVVAVDRRHLRRVDPAVNLRLVADVEKLRLQGRDGVIDDIWIEGGTIVPRPADPHGFHRIDCTGLVVMPGGIDLHSHVAGPKVGFGRRIAPQLARREGAPAAVPTPSPTPGAGGPLESTSTTGVAAATKDAAQFEEMKTRKLVRRMVPAATGAAALTR